MYPVAGGTVRAPKRDVLLAGKYVIPKRVTVLMPVRASPRAAQGYTIIWHPAPAHTVSISKHCSTLM